MGATKNPTRVLDGPNAAWDTSDTTVRIRMGTGFPNAFRLGQALCIDTTYLGADNAQDPLGTADYGDDPLPEIACIPSNANAGPVIGIITGMPVASVPFSMSYPAGIPTWTYSAGAPIVVTVPIRQLGWGYVFVGCTTAGARASVLVGSSIVTTSQNYCIVSTSPTIGTFVGTALATAINTQQQTGVLPTFQTAGPSAPVTVAAPMGPGTVSVIPRTLVGLVPGTLLLADALGSGVQEVVSVGAVSYPAIALSFANAHAANFPLTGPNTGTEAKSTVLLSTPNVISIQAEGLVACWINVLS